LLRRKLKDKNLGGSEGRVCALSGLRRHESATGECCVAVELARAHGDGASRLKSGVIEEKLQISQFGLGFIYYRV
jgi:hypothetical protein